MESNTYVIPSKEATKDDMERVWGDLEGFKIKSKYGSIFNSKKFVDKIKTYNKNR